MPRKAGRDDYQLRTRRTLHKGGGGVVKKLARTTASHGANVTQAVNLCDKDFVELSPVESKDAINDSGVTIPSGAKTYIEKFESKWRITWADVCEG